MDNYSPLEREYYVPTEESSQQCDNEESFLWAFSSGTPNEAEYQRNEAENQRLEVYADVLELIM